MTQYHVTSLFVLIGCQLAACYLIAPPIPVATPEPGFRYNPSTGPDPSVKLEMFIDLNCNDSYTAWPVLLKVANHYGNARLDLVIKMLPMPYHRNAFLSTQGLYVVQAEAPSKVFSFIDAMLTNNHFFITSNTVNKTETQVREMLADIAVTSSGVNRGRFISELDYYRPQVIQHWKYSIRRLNSGTPAYSVNGVDAAITGYPVYEDWIAFLDPIVGIKEPTGQLSKSVGKLSLKATDVIRPGTPVLHTAPGIRYRPAISPPPVNLDIFIDLNCPDSRDAWPIIKQVQLHYGTHKVNLIVQLMPLPYHRNSLLCTQGMFAIHASTHSAFLFSYVEESMNMWDNFSTAATINMTQTDVLSMLGDMANRVTGINKELFIADIPNHLNYADALWKFGAKHGVAGTPMFYVNGVPLVMVTAPTFQDWIAFLDPIINV